MRYIYTSIEDSIRYPELLESIISDVRYFVLDNPDRSESRYFKELTADRVIFDGLHTSRTVYSFSYTKGELIDFFMKRTGINITKDAYI